MEINNPQYFTSRQQWRNWLIENHKNQKECWVSVTRNKNNTTLLLYLDAVEEALCFGWIDSTTKSQDGITYQRFSPRRKTSNWTELNKERVRRLERLGLMTDAGRASLPADFESPFTIESEILNILQSDPIVWQNFQNFPPLYQRIRIGNIQFRRRQKLDYQTMLKRFIEETRKNKIYGEWHDNGRLL